MFQTLGSPGRRPLLAALALLLAAPLAAQTDPAQTDPDQVTFDRLFASRDFAGERTGGFRWMDGEHTTGFEDGDAGRDLVRTHVTTGAQQILVTAAQMTPDGWDTPISVEDYTFSEDERRVLLYTNSERVWRANTRGDYWVLDRDAGTLRQIGGDAPVSSLMFASFSPDGGRVAYVSEHDIYVEDVATGAITALTTDGSDRIINGTFDWVYEEEFGQRKGFRWAPDGEHVAYWRLDASGIRDFLMINNTDSLYSYTIPIQYPKAGTTNSAAKIGVVSAAGGATRWFRLSDDERNHYPARMEWAESSTELVIQHLDRLQQRNEVLLADIETMTASPILIETDDAWTDAVDDLVWFDDGAHFTWVSDRDGWKRVYVVSRDGSGMRAVTPAGEDVLSILQIDTDGGWVYTMGAPTNGPATQRVLSRSSLTENRTERLTPGTSDDGYDADGGGTHSYQLSPGARYAVHRVSSFGDPGRTELLTLPDHAVARTLATNDDLRATLGALDRGRSWFTTVDTPDGTALDAYLMLPADFDSTRSYPMLVHVYGEPWGLTVNDSYGGFGYLWHLMLTQRGYIVASIDPRGTPSPKGRDWRKVVYGQIGVHAAADMADGTSALAERHSWIDPDRVAIWGWSGGGSQTLNAMFRYPDVFALGMAVAPVPDQKLYDTIYQERYMGLPQDNPEGYAAGSPITHADGLEGDLLLVHGTGDDNVHYQGTERLINRLVELNKPFTMMAYPNRSHGIYEGRGTRRHLYEMMTRYLEDNLPAGPQ